MIAKYAFLLIIATLFLSGCANKVYYSIYNPKELHGIQITGQIAGIDIVDYRLQSLTKDIEIPKSQFSGYEIIAHPALTNNNKKFIDWKIHSYFTNTGERLKVVCYIVNTVKKATKTFFKHREFVLVEMSIAIYDENNKLLDFITSSSSFEQKPSISIQYEINDLFEQAIGTAIYQCFDEFKNIKKTITLGRAYRYSVIKKDEL
ncbi:MAG: hypothetical protein WC384_20035 [Prolixibacteraceae bacterium]|jgi:hypothetical protein